MSFDAIVGGQWGDEGKGKIVDLLSKNVDVVARYQGGANAGHTVYKDDKKIVLHQIPTGALRESSTCVLGNGMVIDPIGILEEINKLKELNITIKDRIFIDFYAHIVTPIHKYIDRVNEAKTNNEIGTTCKGIGPTYTDKYRRIGIRAIDILDMNILKDKVNNRLQFALDNNEIPNNEINALKNELTLFYKTCLDITEYIRDTFDYLHNALQKNILIEGAQGTMLDVDYGTYPYVTSSNCSSGGIGTGLGIPGSKLNNITGIFKAYTTRVGGGPFPTELFNEVGEKLGDIGKEFGATTGRPRRCGWFDLVAAKYSAKVNGLTHIAITKLDILNSFKEIRVCISYDINGNNILNMSAALNELHNVKPVYKTFTGWDSDISDIDNFKELPSNAQKYIQYLEEEIGVPISIISIGPKRHQIIYRNK